MKKFTPDFHVHSSFSPDSSMSRENAVKAALQQGITHLCFTEHMDLGHHLDSFNRVPDFGGMHTSVCSLREQFPDIHIYHGLEAGYKRYLETLLESVADSTLTDYYDCIGHIGYIAKCRHFDKNTLPYDFAPKLFDDILSLIIKKGKGIEVNTSGIDKVGHTLPHPSIIQRYRDLGRKIITVGSDAHTTDRVGKHIAQVMQIVKECGFNEIAVFKERKPEFYKI